MQLKMVLTKIEEWARAKIGHDYGQIANEELDPAREAANVLFFLNKKDLTQESTRNTVCPRLRPVHIRHLLQKYKPDEFDQEVIPQSLLQTLDQQEQSYFITPKTFNPSLRKALELNFEMSPLDLSYLTLPKLVVDRSGFSFLKSNPAPAVVYHTGERW